MTYTSIRSSRRFLLLLLLLSLGAAKAQNTAKKTQVLILGTTHLSQIDNFDPQMIEPVVQKLETFNFDVVCIEKMPGQLLYDIDRRKDPDFQLTSRDANHLRWADSVQQFRKVSFAQAKERIYVLLKKESLTLQERKELLYHYVATANIPAAVLQYRYLQEQEALFSSEFDQKLTTYLASKLDNANEYYSMAVPLAFRSGHNTIEPIDNFQEMSFQQKYFPMFEEDIKRNPQLVASLMELPVYTKSQQLMSAGLTNKDLTALYEYINSDTYMKQDYKAQWELWLKTEFDSQSDRARYSYWEMRNLQIAANILAVAAKHPGKKLLVIIGSAHKSYLEKFLHQVKDFEVLTY